MQPNIYFASFFDWSDVNDLVTISRRQLRPASSSAVIVVHLELRIGFVATHSRKMSKRLRHKFRAATHLVLAPAAVVSLPPEPIVC
ncbi:MAG: hypothetical protein KF708_15955 [Pirellulales bacterium]|nr:hypothetical protein [Pirellulales bacterium]